MRNKSFLSMSNEDQIMAEFVKKFRQKGKRKVTDDFYRSCLHVDVTIRIIN